MHKQQLEQVQQQHQANSTANSSQVSIHPHSAACLLSLTASLITNSLRLQQSMANTLDQASAQFAASALVTAEQLLVLKTKDELAPGGGVNGILSSGTSAALSQP